MASLVATLVRLNHELAQKIDDAPAVTRLARSATESPMDAGTPP
ncbi:MAG TPA: hypothetical protein VGI44_10820 [Acidimicrobiales bacterium]